LFSFVLEFSLKMWKCEVSDQGALGQVVFDHLVQDQEDGLAEAPLALRLQFHALIHGEVPDQLEGVIHTLDNHGVLQALWVEELVEELL